MTKTKELLGLGIDTFLGIPIHIAPKNIKIKRPWPQRLYMRPLWPFGSVKWKYESLIDDNQVIILGESAFGCRRIITSEKVVALIAKEAAK